MEAKISYCKCDENGEGKKKRRNDLLYEFNPDQMKQGLNRIPALAGPDKNMLLIHLCRVLGDTLSSF